MYGHDICDLHFAPIEFYSANAQGWHEYDDGIPATCAADDDLSVAIGADDDPLLKEALAYLDTGACSSNASARTRRARSLEPVLPASRLGD